MGRSRRRERDQVAAVARRRMALLEAELAGLRAGDEAVPDGADRSDPEPSETRRAAREPGQHRQHDPRREARAEERREAPSTVPHPRPLRSGRPGMLDDSSGDWSGGSSGVPESPARSGRPAFGPAGGREPEPTYAFETAPLRVGPYRVDEPFGDREDRDDPDAENVRATTGVGAWLVERLPESLQGRVALSGRAVVALLVLAVLAVVVVGWTTLRSGSGDPVPAASVRAPAVSAAASPAAVASGGPTRAASSGASPATGGASGVVVVDVAGKVRRPGIVTLPAGSRVHEAIERAGGPRAGVSLTRLNLARVLVDGEQILVGVGGAAAPGSVGTSTIEGTVGSGGSGAAPGALVNLNTADAAGLDTLPGVGEVTAQKILDYRSSHGAFTSVDQLLDVDGIGEKTLADIKPRVTV